MKIIVGLGNPGSEYALTRHNIGFRVLTKLAEGHSTSFSVQKSLACELCKVKIGQQEALFAKPTTYMNDSGRAVRAVLDWYKASASELLVVHDDVSLPLGRLRVQHGGGAGGQHGIESIIEYLGGQSDFDRLKFGIGPDPGGDVRKDFVLSKVPKSKQTLLEKCIESAVDAVNFWLEHGVHDAMNKFNGVNFENGCQ